MIRTIIVLIATLLFVTLNMTGCQSPLEKEAQTEVEIVETEEEKGISTIAYGDIQVTDIEQVTLENPDLILLDVRTEIENEEDAIPNSLVIPVEELEDRISELSKDKTYIVYCRSGNRSSQAMRILKKEGFNKLFHMLGGMNKYRQVFPK